MSKPPTRVTLVCSVLLLAASISACSDRFQSSAEASSITPADDEYLRMAAHQWDSLFNVQDAVALAATYAEDYVSMPHDSPDIYGRIARQGRFLSFFSDFTAAHETDVEELIMSKGSCIELARYVLTYSARSSPSQVIRVTGRHVVCRKKIGGKWLITWKVRNTDQPSGAPPEV